MDSEVKCLENQSNSTDSDDTTQIIHQTMASESSSDSTLDKDCSVSEHGEELTNGSSDQVVEPQGRELDNCDETSANNISGANAHKTHAKNIVNYAESDMSDSSSEETALQIDTCSQSESVDEGNTKDARSRVTDHVTESIDHVTQTQSANMVFNNTETENKMTRDAQELEDEADKSKGDTNCVDSLETPAQDEPRSASPPSLVQGDSNSTATCLVTDGKTALLTEVTESQAIDDSGVLKDITDNMEYREEADARQSDISSSSDDDGDSDIDMVHDATSEDESSDDGAPKKERRRKKSSDLQSVLPKTKGEMLVTDLPPIEDLAITVDENVVMVHVGKVLNIVDSLVIVQALTALPPLDMETILFLEERKVLGQVFETFGPVSAPLYSVRYNSRQHVEERGIEPGLMVYYAPDAPEYTQYVFTEFIKKIKGSDASWEHNNEPPEHFIDYSDDEEERKAKNQRALEKRMEREKSGLTPKPRKRATRKMKDVIEDQGGNLEPNQEIWPPKSHNRFPSKPSIGLISGSGHGTSELRRHHQNNAWRSRGPAGLECHWKSGPSWPPRGPGPRTPSPRCGQSQPRGPGGRFSAQGPGPRSQGPHGGRPPPRWQQGAPQRYGGPHSRPPFRADHNMSGPGPFQSPPGPGNSQSGFNGPSGWGSDNMGPRMGYPNRSPHAFGQHSFSPGPPFSQNRSQNPSQNSRSFTDTRLMQNNANNGPSNMSGGSMQNGQFPMFGGQQPPPPPGPNPAFSIPPPRLPSPNPPLIPGGAPPPPPKAPSTSRGPSAPGVSPVPLPPTAGTSIPPPPSANPAYNSGPQGSSAYPSPYPGVSPDPSITAYNTAGYQGSYGQYPPAFPPPPFSSQGNLPVNGTVMPASSAPFPTFSISNWGQTG